MMQSSLSASLLARERGLGTDLFTRSLRGAELTDAGRAFRTPARSALAHADGARDAVAEVQGLLRRTVRITVESIIDLPRAACTDDEVFDRVDVATLAGAPLCELGVAYRDDSGRRKDALSSPSAAASGAARW
jgi:hypothetical protein